MDWVWLLGAFDDPHLDAVQTWLSRRGTAVVRTASRDRFRLVYRPEDVAECRVDNRSLRDCTGAYVRRLPPRLRLDADAKRPSLDELYLSQLEADAWRDTVWALLRILDESGAAVLNPPGAGIVATPKLDVLRRAHLAGLRIPDTLVTSSTPEGTNFVAEAEQAVAKPVRGGAHATLMLPGDERLSRLWRAPVTLQQRAFGPDLRVVMLDGRVLSAARLEGLFAQGVDFRADPAYQRGEARYVPSDLDADTAGALADLCTKLGVRLCGADFKLTDEGPVFLEANLAPAYLEQEREVGADITGAVAATLRGR